MKTNRLLHAASLALALSAPFLATARDPQFTPSAAATPQLAARRVEKLDPDSMPEGSPIGLSRSSGDLERSLFRAINSAAEMPDQPLIISATTLDDKSVAAINEDMTIMARILTKSADRVSAEDSAERKAMNIHLFTLSASAHRSPRNMYIDGYGAIFILNVSMPLLPTPVKLPPEEKKEPASSAWEEARNELYGGDETTTRKANRARGASATSSKERPAEFDQARFDALKKNLADAFKNATHIRSLKEAEFVTVVVQGPAIESSEQKVQFRTNSSSTRPENFVFTAGSLGPRSLLTLRAKKGDVDAFAKGKIDADDFRKKLDLASYQSSHTDLAKAK